VPRLVGVLRFDEEAEEFELDDAAERPIPIDAARLRLARSEVEGARNRMIELVKQPSGGDTARAAMEALRETLRMHAAAPIGNRGIAGIRTLASRMRQSGRRGGWAESFPGGAALYHALASLYRWIEHGSAGTALGRSLWVAYLRELGEVRGFAGLADELEGWADIAQRWSNLAESALPQDVPRLQEARRLMESKYIAYRREGLDAARTIVATHSRLAAVATEMDAEFPLNQDGTLELLDDLSVRLEDLAALEGAACARLLALSS
jgi:hypothetical protein